MRTERDVLSYTNYLESHFSSNEHYVKYKLLHSHPWLPCLICWMCDIFTPSGIGVTLIAMRGGATVGEVGVIHTHDKIGAPEMMVSI